MGLHTLTVSFFFKAFLSFSIKNGLLDYSKRENIDKSQEHSVNTEIHSTYPHLPILILKFGKFTNFLCFFFFLKDAVIIFGLIQCLPREDQFGSNT